jgi:hypothetical protein
VLEWLRTMAAAQYLDCRPESNAFEMPAEHISVLVDEDSPTFSMGLVEGTVPDILMVPRVLAAFGTGKGIPYGDYPAETFDAIERITKPDYRHRLTQRWLLSRFLELWIASMRAALRQILAQVPDMRPLIISLESLTVSAVSRVLSISVRCSRVLLRFARRMIFVVTLRVWPGASDTVFTISPGCVPSGFHSCL